MDSVRIFRRPAYFCEITLVIPGTINLVSDADPLSHANSLRRLSRNSLPPPVAQRCLCSVGSADPLGCGCSAAPDNRGAEFLGKRSVSLISRGLDFGYAIRERTSHVERQLGF